MLSLENHFVCYSYKTVRFPCQTVKSPDCLLSKDNRKEIRLYPEYNR